MYSETFVLEYRKKHYFGQSFKTARHTIPRLRLRTRFTDCHQDCRCVGVSNQPDVTWKFMRAVLFSKRWNLIGRETRKGDRLQPNRISPSARETPHQPARPQLVHYPLHLPVQRSGPIEHKICVP